MPSMFNLVFLFLVAKKKIEISFIKLGYLPAFVKNGKRKVGKKKNIKLTNQTKVLNETLEEEKLCGNYHESLPTLNHLDYQSDR